MQCLARWFILMKQITTKQNEVNLNLDKNIKQNTKQQTQQSNMIEIEVVCTLLHYF